MDHSNETAKEQIERIEMELKIDEKIKDTPFNSFQEAFLPSNRSFRGYRISAFGFCRNKARQDFPMPS